MRRAAILLLLLLLLLRAAVSRPQDGGLTTGHLWLSSWKWHPSGDMEDRPNYELRLPQSTPRPWESGSAGEVGSDSPEGD
jgi:hypothetical protein